MAQNNTVGTILKIGIVAGIVVLCYLIYRWWQGYKGGDTLFGTSKTPGSGGGSSAGISGASAGGNVFERLNNAYTQKIANPLKEDVTAAELVIANTEAKKFGYNQPAGTSVWINKALKSAMKLSDTQFLTSVRRWLELSKQKDFYQTDLVSGNINNSRRSDFITRYGTLTGSIQGQSDAHYANGGAVPTAALKASGANMNATLSGVATALGLGGKII